MSLLRQYRSFTARVERAVDKALTHEVAQTVKDIMEECAQEDVYAYPASPAAMTSRRGTHGGLGDRKFMQHHIEPDHVLVVEDIAPFQHNTNGPYALSDVVEKGIKGYRQPYPRPFVGHTEEEAISSGRALDALRKGMRRQGIEMESGGLI